MCPFGGFHVTDREGREARTGVYVTDGVALAFLRMEPSLSVSQLRRENLVAARHERGRATLPQSGLPCRFSAYDPLVGRHCA